MKRSMIIAIAVLASTGVDATECYGGAELAQKVIAGGLPVKAVDDPNGPSGTALSYEPDGRAPCVLAKDAGFEDVDGRPRPTAGTAAARRQLDPIGEWRNGKAAVLRIAEQEPAGSLRVEGEAVYENAAGSVSTGTFTGRVAGRDLASGGTVRVSRSPAPGEPEDEGCHLDLRSVGGLLIVLDSGTVLGVCGGYGATFSGIYGKVGREPGSRERPASP